MDDLRDRFLERLSRGWNPLLAYSALLGVMLVILGIGLAGLASALKAREKDRGKSTDL